MIRILPIFLISIFITSFIGAQHISEIHYDNAGGDVGEGVEIFIPAGTNTTGWTVALYNGSSTQLNVYSTLTADFDCPAAAGACAGAGAGAAGCTLFIPQAGIQNGSPDGMALVDAGGTVLQFLSYEGSFTAGSGPASGMTSTDIGTAETGTTPIGNSIQISPAGVGSAPAVSDFDDCPETILPIIMGKFQVTTNRDNNVDVAWSTTQETSTDYFDLQWSRDGNSYQSIHIANAQGESNTEINYSYVHKNAETGLNYYRLKQVDRNGEYRYSEIRGLQISSSKSLGFKPSSVNDHIILEGDVQSISLFNTAGQLIQNYNTQNINTLDLSNIRSGMYIIRLNGINSAVTQKMHKR